MRLKILLPTEILVDEDADKIVAEAENGSFCLLPRHVDFVAPLVPGLLSYVASDDGREEFVAVDVGILVKRGAEVMVSTSNAARGADLGQLRETVAGRFRDLADRERLTRTALARIESNIVRRFMELGEAWND
ncbi:MAG: F0F1 ATP synthase subunit epsilon [Armatimonadota bacterium]|nr:MAG: F0F1 ATP synthase subunit epsilon [Armatimonadota bacterium]